MHTEDTAFHQHRQVGPQYFNQPPAADDGSLGGVREPRRPHPTNGSGAMRSQIQSRGDFDANPGPIPRRVLPRYTSNTRLVH